MREEVMATFVLVHGGWAGSVVWRQLAPTLRKMGHEVYAPTLTGIGERKHLLSREINLDTTAVRFAELGFPKRRVWIRDFAGSLLGRI
jgi:esterase/lipase